MLFVQVTRIQRISLLPRIRKGLFPILSFFIFLLCYNPDAFCSVKQSAEKQGLVPANFLKWDKWGSDYVVLVDKSQQKVMLYKSDNLSAPEKVYQCSTGEHDGQKAAVNDKKTPEGIYFFVNSYTKEHLAPIYGARALPLNYPSIFDQKEGRDGYGIWFHGTNKPLKPNDTSGCVAFVNKDIEELASYVTLFYTPVIISSSIEMATQEELEERAKDITDIIEGWRDAWQNKDVDRYMSFYSHSFKSGDKSWNQLKEYKTRLTKKYKDINVSVDDLSILKNNNVVVASFKQTYRTPVFESSGIKKLYITKNSAEWKIIGETFSLAEAKQIPLTTPLPYNPQDEAADKEQIALTTPIPDNVQEETIEKGQIALATPSPDNSQEGIADKEQIALTTPIPDNVQEETVEKGQIALTTPQPITRQEETAEAKPVALTTPPPDKPQEDIEAFINSWLDAWGNKDIKRYIACYDAKFKSRNMNLASWERHRNKLNKRFRSIKIETSDLKITNVSDNQAEVAFIQEYRADGYMDRGEKNMVLIKKGKEWKIKKEEWTALSE